MEGSKDFFCDYICMEKGNVVFRMKQLASTNTLGCMDLTKYFKNV